MVKTTLSQPLRLVIIDVHAIDDPVNQLKKGEAIILDDVYCKHLAFGCPACGRVAAHKNIYHPETESLSPSVVCDGCGYHGWLRNGWFLNE